MAINRISCPECAAALKSAAGFKPGETISCPKCETDFVVEEPEEDDEQSRKKGKASSGGLAKKKPVKAAVEDEDEEDERPKKKKKKKKRSDDDQEWSYKNSWIRYAILTVLLIVMCVLGYMLYLKQQREARSALVREAPSAIEV